MAGNRPKIGSSRALSPIGPKPANRPRTNSFLRSVRLSSVGLMNIAGSCVPGGSNRSTLSPIVTMTKDARGFRLIVSNRKSPRGRNTRLTSEITRSHASMCSRTSTQTTTSNVKVFAGPHAVVYPEPCRAGMGSGRRDCRRRRIDGGDLRTTGRQGFRHEAAAATEIEHPLARPVAPEPCCAALGASVRRRPTSPRSRRRSTSRFGR